MTKLLHLLVAKVPQSNHAHLASLAQQEKNEIHSAEALKKLLALIPKRDNPTNG